MLTAATIWTGLAGLAALITAIVTLRLAGDTRRKLQAERAQLTSQSEKNDADAAASLAKSANDLAVLYEKRRLLDAESITQLTDRVGQLTTRVDSLADENKAQKVIMDHQAVQIADQSRRLEEQDKKLASALCELQVQAGRLAEAKNENACLQEENAQLRQKSDDLQERVAELERQLETVKANQVLS